MLKIIKQLSSNLLIIGSMGVMGSIVLLSGCATLSKQECMVGDWQTIGYNDGVAGYTADRLALHSKACAKASVALDYQAWSRGRQLGLKQYCTVTSAYNVGRRGQKLSNVCPATLANHLQAAHQQGLDYYALDSQLDKDKQLVKEYQQEFDKLKSGEMLDFTNKKEARARLLWLADELQQAKQRVIITQRQLGSLSNNDAP